MFGASPILHAFWAAGFSFARGHLAVRVPYDCCLPMLFQGEEISIAVRAWTHGYDFYTPHNPVAFHPYHRKSRPPMFWENAASHKGEGARSSRRAADIIRMGDFSDYDHAEADKYGLGPKRRADDFYRIFGIDLASRKTTKDLCKWSLSGRMHSDLVRFLRSDGKGIDYDRAISELDL